MRTLVHLTVPLTVAALALSACEDPYEKDAKRDSGPPPAATAPATTTPAETQPGGSVPPPAELPEEEAVQAPAATPRATPTAVLTEFGRHWANWDWRDVGNQHEVLMPLATGELREEIRVEAEKPVDRTTLERTQPGFKGRVEGVVLKERTGDVRPALVVIRQQEYAHGRPTSGGLHYTVYLAEATRVGDGWAVSRWEGQE